MPPRTLAHRVAILENMMANLVRIGTIFAVDYSGAVPLARVQIGALQTTWLPLPAIRAGGDTATWLLEIGEQVVVLAPGGELEKGVISHALHRADAVSTTSNANVAKLRFSDGSTVEMDRSSGIMTLDPVAKLVVNSDMDLNGKLTHVGDVQRTGAVVQVGGQSITGNSVVTGTTTFTGNLALEGNLNQTSGNVTTDGDVNAGSVSLKNHRHSGVQTGSGDTGTPI